MTEIRKAYLEPFVEALEKVNWAQVNGRVKDAFLKVPRHLFIRRLQVGNTREYESFDRHDPGPDRLKTIYADTAILVHEPLSSSSQPSLMGFMLSQLDVKPGMKVLEIGTGTGYNAALLASGTGDPRLVYSIDIQPDLVEEAREHLADAGMAGVNLRAADAGNGWAGAAPFDRIIATCGCPDLAPAWLDQLAEGGVLLVPFSTRGAGEPLLRLEKAGGRLRGAFVGNSGFMKLQGALRDESQDSDDFVPAYPWLRRWVAGPLRGSRSLRWEDMRGFWLFLRTRAPLFPDLEHGWSEVRRGTWQFVAAGRRSGFVAKYDSDAALLSAWGAPGACWNLMAALERWKALREAGGGRFTVEVVDDGATADGPNEWLDHRRHVTLRVRFGASGS